jgi:hypothetical protein
VLCWNALEGVPTNWIKKYTGRPLKNIVEQSCDLVMKEEALTEELIATQEENAALKSEIDLLKKVIEGQQNEFFKLTRNRNPLVASQPTKEPK